MLQKQNRTHLILVTAIFVLVKEEYSLLHFLRTKAVFVFNG